MPARVRWFDRSFDFNFPVETYPELIERLRGTPARLAESLGRAPPELCNRRKGKGWSIQEHGGHLADLDVALFLARLDDYDAGIATLRAADLANRVTEAADHNARAVGEVVEGFRASRDLVVARLERLEPAAFGREALHPRLQRTMRVVDMMFFHAEHDDYHLARITELLRGAAL